MNTQTDKDLILNALREFITQRPGLEFANYGDVAAYRAGCRVVEPAA